MREVHIQKHRKWNSAPADERSQVDKEAEEEPTREREGGGSTTEGYVGKFEMKDDQEKGSEKEEAKGVRERSAESDTKRVEEKQRGKEEEARAEKVDRSRLEAVNNYRTQALQNRKDSIAIAQEKAKQAASDDHEELGGGPVAAKEMKKEKPQERESSEAKSEGSSEKSLAEPGGVCQAVGQIPKRDTNQDESKNKEHTQNMKAEGEKGSKVFPTYADVVKDGAARKEHEQYEDIAGYDQGEKEQAEGGYGVVLQMEKKPLLDNYYSIEREGGREVLGAVGEIVAEIGETMMKPAEKVVQQGQEEGKGGVLGAIGETVAEIAETTKVLVVGEGETESRQSIGSLN